MAMFSIHMGRQRAIASADCHCMIASDSEMEGTANVTSLPMSHIREEVRYMCVRSVDF